MEPRGSLCAQLSRGMYVMTEYMAENSFAVMKRS